MLILPKNSRIQHLFVNDHNMGSPISQAEWQGAIRLLHSVLGLGRHSLAPFIIDAFVDVGALG